MKKILQVFKKLFKREPQYSGKAYICDPIRNTACSKDGCWHISKGPCKCTLKKKYAKLDKNGKAMKATDDDLCNLEWMEQQISIQKQMVESMER